MQAADIFMSLHSSSLYYMAVCTCSNKAQLIRIDPASGQLKWDQSIGRDTFASEVRSCSVCHEKAMQPAKVPGTNTWARPLEAVLIHSTANADREFHAKLDMYITDLATSPG